MNYQDFFNQNNFNQPNNYPQNMDQNYENVTYLPPIVTRDVNVVHKNYLIKQPHICEYETKVCNHFIKKHDYCCKPIVTEYCDFQEENEGCCPKACGCNGGMFF